MTRPVIAILFDLDGTLADTALDLARSAIDALLAVNEISPAVSSLLAYGSRGGRGMLNAGWIGPKDDSLFSRAFEIFLDQYASRMFDTTTLFDGIHPFLRTLDQLNVPWGIVTNKGRRYSEPLVQHLALLPKVLVCGDMVHRPKPASDSLLAAAAHLKVSPNDCLYIGDDGKDVVAARAAGMRSVAVLYGYSVQLGDLDLQTADFKVNSITELVQLVSTLVDALNCAEL